MNLADVREAVWVTLWETRLIVFHKVIHADERNQTLDELGFPRFP